MARMIFLSLFFSLAVSLIWWPGTQNKESIFDLIEKERLWQAENLGFDVVDAVDEGIDRTVEVFTTSPIPKGSQSTLPYSTSVMDQKIEEAVLRVIERPYWQAMYALIILALGRLLVTVHLASFLLPLLIPAVVDALSIREVRHVQFKLPNAFRFRLSATAVCLLAELMIVISMVPIWIHPNVMLVGFFLLGLCIHQMTKHYYR